MAFETIAVCGLDELDRRTDMLAATHIVSLLHPADSLRLPNGFSPARHLRVDMEDTVDIRSPHAPIASQVAKVSAWCSELPDDSRLLVHCLAGISRSPAMALGLLTEVHGPEEACRQLRRIRREATPNPRVVALWDSHLRLEGTLIAAAERTFDKPAWMRRQW